MNFPEERIKHICDWLTINKPNESCDFYKMWLAVEILRVMVDNEWTNQAIFPNDHPTTSREVQQAIEFLRTKEIGFQYQERVYRLANRLYDIQNVSGLQKVIDAIKQGDIVLGYSEIEASSFFQRRNIEHKFVIPSRKKGQDFDIKLKQPEVNCEVKHKIEDTIPAKEKLERTLSSAKKQVPQESASIFFIKIPIEWVKHRDFKSIIERTKGTFFPRSESILGFILHWEEQVLGQEGVFFWKYRYEKNPYYKLQNNKLSAILQNTEVDFEDTLTGLMNKYIKKCN